jgi:hypothetical protein
VGKVQAGYVAVFALVALANGDAGEASSGGERKERSSLIFAATTCKSGPLQVSTGMSWCFRSEQIRLQSDSGASLLL